MRDNDMKILRRAAGHTQPQAARYLYTSERTIRSIEAGKEDPARMELYRLKLEKSGIITEQENES